MTWPCFYVLSYTDADTAVVSVQGAEAASMVDDHRVAVTTIPICNDDLAGCGCIHRRSHAHADIHPGMTCVDPGNRMNFKAKG